MGAKKTERDFISTVGSGRNSARNQQNEGSSTLPEINCCILTNLSL